MKNILYILVLIFLTSCTSNTIYKKPENLITKDSMVVLISDMYIAMSTKNVINKNLERKVNYMPFVYAKYKIDSARFNKSNIYYTSVIEEYNEILLEVKERIKKEHKKYAQALSTQDSIKNEAKRKIKEKRMKELKKEGILNKSKVVDTLLLKKKSAKVKGLEKEELLNVDDF